MQPYLEAFLRLIYPASCGVCEALLELEEQGICGTCRGRLRSLRFSPEDAVLEKRFEALDDAWSLYPYESPVKEILVAIKFLRKRWLVRVFAEEMTSLAQVLTADRTYDLLVPIPIDRQKLLVREFNQSQLLTYLVARRTCIPTASNLLRKRRSSLPQNQLSREERRVNLHRGFEVTKKRRVEGKTILLVDDIVTTGATAEEAARTLKASGAKRVDLFALARTHLES